MAVSLEENGYKKKQYMEVKERMKEKGPQSENVDAPSVGKDLWGDDQSEGVNNEIKFRKSISHVQTIY